MKRVLIAICIICISLLLSCARSVSNEIEKSFFELVIDFKVKPDLVNNIYVVVFSSNNVIQPNNPILNDYYIFPGNIFDSNTLASLDRDVNYYYKQFFSSWSKFIYISDTQTQLTTSAEGLFEATTTQNFTYEETIGFEYNQSINNNSIKIIIELDELGFNIMRNWKDSLTEYINDYYSNYL